MLSGRQGRKARLTASQKLSFLIWILYRFHRPREFTSNCHISSSFVPATNKNLTSSPSSCKNAIFSASKPRATAVPAEKNKLASGQNLFQKPNMLADNRLLTRSYSYIVKEFYIRDNGFVRGYIAPSFRGGMYFFGSFVLKRSSR
jgi:hypothetical protein